MGLSGTGFKVGIAFYLTFFLEEFESFFEEIFVFIFGSSPTVKLGEPDREAA